MIIIYTTNQQSNPPISLVTVEIQKFVSCRSLCVLGLAKSELSPHHLFATVHHQSWSSQDLHFNICLVCKTAFPIQYPMLKYEAHRTFPLQQDKYQIFLLILVHSLLGLCLLPEVEEMTP